MSAYKTSTAVRTALVTGGTGGIGSLVVDRLRSDGLEVITLDRAGDADIVLDVWRDPLPADVLSRVDVCVTAAAVTNTIAAAHEMTDEQWSRDIGVNLTGAFRVISACLAGMRERQFGRIVAISSAVANLGLPGQVGYAASKAGLLGMVRTVAVEGARHRITANCVLPGVIASPGVANMPPHVLEGIHATLPSGRMGSCADVASLISFLVSEEAGYVNGQALNVDGALGLGPFHLGGRRLQNQLDAAATEPG